MHRYIRSGFESRQTKPHFARNAQVPGPQGPLPPSAARPQGHGWRQACPACQLRRPCPGGPAPARAPGPQRAASGGPRQRKGRLGKALASKQALWTPPASHAARLRPAHAPARCREPVRNLAVRGESAKSGWAARRKPQTGLVARRGFATLQTARVRAFRTHGRVVNRFHRVRQSFLNLFETNRFGVNDLRESP